MSTPSVTPVFTVPPPIPLGRLTLRFETPVLMGILNVTPDSFSDGGEIGSVDAALRRAHEHVTAGATILDIGGESTRPGSSPVEAEAEIARVLPVIEALEHEQLPAAISIDTSKAAVARAAIEHGATMVNDVTALGDPEMAPLVARHGAALVLMHMRGEPRTMQSGEIVYRDLLGEVGAVLEHALDTAVRAGVPRERVLIDPGIGFGKSVSHNLSLTRHLDAFRRLGRPVVYGPSRKSFLGAVTGRPVEDRERATAAACALAVLAGADVLRVHNVAAVRDAISVAAAVRNAEMTGG